MCEICLQSPCAAACPNAPEPTIVYVCSGCGNYIYEDDDVWHIMGEQFCEKCIEDARKVAHYDPY